jgi:uncharacterized protein with beta-barrel porin domain
LGDIARTAQSRLDDDAFERCRVLDRRRLDRLVQRRQLYGCRANQHRQHEDRHGHAATFQTLPGASFVVSGAAQARDSALVTTAAELKWLNGFSLGATFEGAFSDVTRSYAGKGVARYNW